MKKIRTIIAVILAISCSTTFAQTSLPKERLSVGDQLPDLVFNDITNYPKGELKMSDFKGKLLIIDVWNRWCSSCISGFPKMESLKNKYGDQIDIVLLTKDARKDFDKLRDRSPIIKETQLPFVVGDTMINKLFPHKGVPLHIWVDSTKKIVAVTSGYNTHEKNINAYLNGEKMDVNERVGEIMDFNPEAPLFSEGDGRHANLITNYSFFMKSMPNYRFNMATYVHDSARAMEYEGIKFVNTPLPIMILMAYDFTEASFDFEGGEKYIVPKDISKKNDFVTNFTFCYESHLPERYKDSTEEQRKQVINNRLIEDIKFQFGFNMDVQDKTYPCLYLQKLTEKTKTTKCTDMDYVSESDKSTWFLKCASNSQVAGAASDILEKRIIDKTNNIDDRHTIDFYIKDATITTINQQLKTIGLKLVEGDITEKRVIVTKQ